MRLTGVGVETGGGATGTTGVVMMAEDWGGRESLRSLRGSGGRFGAPLRLIGDGRASRSSLCAFPTMEFLLTPSLRPISLVAVPFPHSSLRVRIAPSVQMILILQRSPDCPRHHEAA